MKEHKSGSVFGLSHLTFTGLSSWKAPRAALRTGTATAILRNEVNWKQSTGWVRIKITVFLPCICRVPVYNVPLCCRWQNVYKQRQKSHHRANSRAPWRVHDWSRPSPCGQMMKRVLKTVWSQNQQQNFSQLEENTDPEALGTRNALAKKQRHFLLTKCNKRVACLASYKTSIDVWDTVSS